MSNNANSDPMPFTQVDRSVKPKAALLAGMLGVTNQHALGSLIEWWELFGDPREIERLIAEGISAIIVTPEEAERRFRIASGKSVSASDLVAIGLLAPADGGVRVRGMSRYFEPVHNRIQKRQAASLGGKASAARRSMPASAEPQASAQADAQARAGAAGEASGKHGTTQKAEGKDNRKTGERDGAAAPQQPAEGGVSAEGSGGETTGSGTTGGVNARPIEATSPDSASPPRILPEVALERLWGRLYRALFGSPHLPWGQQEKVMASKLMARLDEQWEPEWYVDYLFSNWARLRSKWRIIEDAPMPHIGFAWGQVDNLYDEARAWAWRTATAKQKGPTWTHPWPRESVADR